MSNAVSALDGASYEGYVRVTEQGLRGMITLRGDLSSAKLKAVVAKLTGVKPPAVTGCSFSGAYGVAWMSPDELLILCPYDAAEAGVAQLSKALKGQHFLAANVSDARAVFRIAGAGTREVLAKLAPVDMSRNAFQPGQLRRTRIAQAPAAFWMTEDGAAEVICFRSQAEYVFELFKRAAMPGAEARVF